MTKLIAPFIAALVAFTAAATTIGTGQVFSGDATCYNQGGAAGSCGDVHEDTDYIAALSHYLYDEDGNLCGRRVVVTNPANNNQVTVTIADKCEGCEKSDIDLSVVAFNDLFGGPDIGRAAVTWSFIS